MKVFTAVVAVSAAALAACAGAVTLKVAGGVSYYYGQVSSFSPDGKLPYGKNDLALKREVLDGGARVVETVTEAAPAPGMRPRVTVTELKRRKKTLVYDAADDKGAFSGTVTFKDPALSSWTYRIKFVKGGELTGSGSLSGDGIKTEKSVTGPGRPMMLREDLKAVSEDNYRVQVGMMMPARGME